MKIKSFILILLVLFASLFIMSCNNQTEIEETEESEEINLPQMVDSNVSFAYGQFGLTKYIYDDDNRITDIVTLSIYSMSEFIENSNAYKCKYEYDNGVLSSLVYMGKLFTPDKTDEQGRVISAVSDNGVYVDFTYGENGIVVKEDFYDNGQLVLTNEFNSKGRPTSVNYYELGKLTYDYSDGVIYVTMNLVGTDEASPDITIYLDDNGYPYACSEVVDIAMIGYTWTYIEDYKCTNTVVETVYAGQATTEEYVIYYNDDGSIEKILKYTYKADGTPKQLADYRFEYNADGTPKQRVDTDYDDNFKVEKKVINLYEDTVRTTVTTELYTDGALSEKTYEKSTFDENGVQIKQSNYSYSSNDTFVSGTDEEYEYEDGKLRGRTSYFYGENKSLTQIFKEHHTVDELGRNTSSVYEAYEPTGELREKEVDEFEYDENSNVIRQSISIYEKDELVHKDVSEYVYLDGELDKTVVTRFDKDGKVIGSFEE